MTRRKDGGVERIDRVAVDVSRLRPNNSYGVPDFVERGYYVERPFNCQECGALEVWRASQQKWWYEVAKGYAWSGAKLCRACRMVERTRRAQARGIHLRGLGQKRARG